MHGPCGCMDTHASAPGGQKKMMDPQSLSQVLGTELGTLLYKSWPLSHSPNPSDDILQWPHPQWQCPCHWHLSMTVSIQDRHWEDDPVKMQAEDGVTLSKGKRCQGHEGTDEAGENLPWRTYEWPQSSWHLPDSEFPHTFVFQSQFVIIYSGSCRKLSYFNCMH